MFIKVNEVWGMKIRPVYLNVNLITDVADAWNKSNSELKANATIGMISTDGENNPLIFRVTETVDEVMELINGN